MWSEVLKYCLRKKLRNLCLLRRLAKKWDFNEDWHELSTTTIRRNLKEARLHYRQYKPQAAADIRAFLGQLAQDYADRDDQGHDADHHLRKLQREEDERAAFQRI